MGVYQENYQEYVGWNGGRIFYGDDTLANFANHVDIYPGYGNDSIQNWGEVVLIDCNEGDDVVINFASNVTVDGGNGNDEIYTHTDIYNISIDGGFSGNDTIAITVLLIAVLLVIVSSKITVMKIQSSGLEAMITSLTVLMAIPMFGAAVVLKVMTR